MVAWPAQGEDNPPLFFQATVATQAHPSFHALYSGKNSLQSEAESALSVVMDLGARIRPWTGAEVVVQPELAGGRGSARPWAWRHIRAGRSTASAIRSLP